MELLASLVLLNATLISLNSSILNASTSPIFAPGLTIHSHYDEWINDLRQCESGGDDNALNPRDTDGTPSKGRFQFKDRTFAWLSKKYNIKTTSIWNGEEQEQILRRMIEDRDINLKTQFPSCTKQIGLPVLVE